MLSPPVALLADAPLVDAPEPLNQPPALMQLVPYHSGKHSGCPVRQGSRGEGYAIWKVDKLCILFTVDK